MISVVVWKWGHRYGPDTVNTLFRMVRRWYGRHRPICVTNDATGIDADVEIITDREDFAGLQNPSGAQFPNCYRRLRLFKGADFAEFGQRVVSLDLDAVIVGDLHPLWDRPEGVVAWEDPLYPAQLNGSMLLLKSGTHREVWARFDPLTSPTAAKVAGFRGSDQAWLSLCLPAIPRWTQADGVFSFRQARELPADARIVFFHGGTKPWSVGAQRLEWVRELYR